MFVSRAGDQMRDTQKILVWYSQAGQKIGARKVTQQFWIQYGEKRAITSRNSMIENPTA